MYKYGWYNEKEKLWQVGDKDELNYLRISGTVCSSVIRSNSSSKKATKKFEQRILSRNRVITYQ